MRITIARIASSRPDGGPRIARCSRSGARRGAATGPLGNRTRIAMNEPIPMIAASGAAEMNHWSQVKCSWSFGGM